MIHYNIKGKQTQVFNYNKRTDLSHKTHNNDENRRTHLPLRPHNHNTTKTNTKQQ